MVYLMKETNVILESLFQDGNITTTASMADNATLTESQSSNDTTNNCSSVDSAPSNFQIVTAILELLLMILICFGNGMVIVAFYRAHRLRTMTNYFIMNLSIADCCVGLLMPFHAALFFRPVLLSDMYVCVFRYSSLMTMLGVSVLCLLALSYDRYSAITAPLRYQGDMSTKKTFVTFLIVWLLPIGGLFVVPFIWNDAKRFKETCNCDFSIVLTSEYIQYIILPCFLICTFVVLFFYIRIFHVARKHIEKIRKMEAQLHARKKFHKSLKITKTAAIVLGVFFASWLPFMITVAIKEYFNVETKHIDDARTWSTLLAVLNSAWNPIIYAFRLRGFKAEFKSMLRIRRTSSDYSSTFRKRMQMLRLHPKQSTRLVPRHSDSSDDPLRPDQPHILKLGAGIILQIAGIDAHQLMLNAGMDVEHEKPKEAQTSFNDNPVLKNGLTNLGFRSGDTKERTTMDGDLGSDLITPATADIKTLDDDVNENDLNCMEILRKSLDNSTTPDGVDNLKKHFDIYTVEYNNRRRSTSLCIDDVIIEPVANNNQDHDEDFEKGNKDNDTQTGHDTEQCLAEIRTTKPKEELNNSLFPSENKTESLDDRDSGYKEDRCAMVGIDSDIGQSDNELHTRVTSSES